MGSTWKIGLKRGLVAGLVVLGLLEATDAAAWSTPNHHRMVRDAVGFLPPVLRGMLRLYGPDLQRGVTEAERFSLELMGPPGAAPDISAALDLEMRELSAAIRAHKPFNQVFYRFGRLVGPVSELNLPLRYPTGTTQFLPEVDSGFNRLSEAAAPKFRILWGGYKDDLMRGLTPAKYFQDTSNQARQLYPVLYSSFVVGGSVVPASSFDFRSIPFGVASMSYSRSVNSIVNVWCAVWREAGGDMSGRPY